MHRFAPRLLLAAVILAGCAGAGPQPATSDGPSTTPGATPGASMSEGGNGAAEGFDGSVATSGLYDATWTVAPDQQVDPFNAVGGRTLLSETGAFGNVSISLGGDVSFGSGAPELSSHGLEFNGTGAQVTLDTSNAYVCAFMVDVDLIAADGAELHIAGSMTVHWYPEGVGAINCP